jgi:hypothetical protein
MAAHCANAPAQTVPTSDGASTTMLAGFGLAGLIVAAVADPATIEDGPVLCPFRLMTGLPCPGCGLTRSWVYLAHGQVDDALGANPFGFVTMAAAVVLAVVVAATLLRRRPVPSLNPVLRSTIFTGVIGVWIAFAVVRLVVVAAA